jgi:hypothetical protein
MEEPRMRSRQTRRSMGRADESIDQQISASHATLGARAQPPPVHLAGLFVEFDEGELQDAIDGEEHVDLTVRMAQFAAVDLDVADGRFGKAAALCFRLTRGQTRNSMPGATVKNACHDAYSAFRLSLASLLPETKQLAGRAKEESSSIMSEEWTNQPWRPPMLSNAKGSHARRV